MKNLTEQENQGNHDFLEGDVVVFIDSLMPDQLMTVHKVQCDGILLDSNRKFALAHLLRHASIRELNTKKRHIMSLDEIFGEMS
ncbi:hypothetical protein [Acinetobacter ursingii]|uniref:hypothetical protein n=1 Tax=Acinetobacter ursingii TaxID=108980 RepID=UPI00125002AF|nr:hypothetical protein [Acinetobacter ursingii]